MNITEDQKRDILYICEKIIESSIIQTCDYGNGGCCPYCKTDCEYNGDIDEVIHDSDCCFIVAKKIYTTLS